MTLNKKVIFVFVLIISFLGVISFLSNNVLKKQGAIIDSLEKNISDVSERDIKILIISKNLRVDVIQVQQWLTDISATRGLSGLNDGFTEAKANAELFKKHIKKAKELAKVSKYKEISKILESMTKAFTPYFEIGNKMAKAYISGGPELGNKMMTDFDTVAEKMSKESEKLVEITERKIKEKVDGILKKAHHISVKNKKQEIVIFYLSIVSIILSFIASIYVSLFISNRFKNLNTDMKDIQNGNYHGSIHLSTADKSEFGAIAVMLKGIKKSLLRIKKLEDDQKKNELLEAEERKNILKEKEDEISSEISGIIEACSNGDFTQRVEIQGKEGLLLVLSKGMNDIGETTLKSLTEVKSILDSFSDGDLTVNISNENKGIFKEIGNSLNNTIRNTFDMVSKIKIATSSVNTASSEIASGSIDLSNRSEHQVETLNITSGVMTNLMKNLEQNVQNINTVNDLAEKSLTVATEGNEVIRESISAMEGIQSSSQEISKIINTIDEIAFQTNLLALNAAVEAARAGDSGKGFAVVASEVRSLAERSAAASNEIKSLINKSIQQVDVGVDLVNQSGTSFSDIVTSVKGVASIVGNITEANTEQTKDINDIANSVSKISESTEQNAALVQESTAAARSMTKQSKTLDELANFFKTK